MAHGGSWKTNRIGAGFLQTPMWKIDENSYEYDILQLSTCRCRSLIAEFVRGVGNVLITGWRQWHPPSMVRSGHVRSSLLPAEPLSAQKCLDDWKNPWDNQLDLPRNSFCDRSLAVALAKVVELLGVCWAVHSSGSELTSQLILLGGDVACKTVACPHGPSLLQSTIRWIVGIFNVEIQISFGLLMGVPTVRHHTPQQSKWYNLISLLLAKAPSWDPLQLA